MSTSKRTIVAVVPDLFFSVRIGETARRLGAALHLVDANGAIAACRDFDADLLILDLEAIDAPRLIRSIREDSSVSGIEVIGFYSHVHDEIRREARAAGADRALPRSAFTTSLAEILTSDGRTRG